MIRRMALVVAVLSLVACRRMIGRPEVHLIPDGYLGPVTIIYNDPSGQSLITSDGAIVYSIPSNGVLRIRDPNPWEEGWKRVRYFYLQPSGEKRELPGSSTAREVAVFGETDGMQAVEIGDSTVAVTYKLYVVGVPSLKGWGAAREAALQRAITDMKRGRASVE